MFTLVFLDIYYETVKCSLFKAKLSSLPGPVVAPLNLRVSDIESSQVTVHWDAVSYESIMGEMKEYKVCVRWKSAR